MLLEREHALQQLRQLSHEASLGHGQIALVQGEAGIGKTALLDNFIQQAKQQFPVLWGQCDALFTPRPLGPLHDMATHFSPELQRQLLTGSESSLLFTALLQFLSERKHGAVLVFEDIHWADNATLDFLNYLVRRLSLLPTLLILSFRDDEVDAEHPLTNLLGLLPTRQTVRIQLNPLSRDATAKLAGNTPELDQLYDITGGNPFFVSEVLESRGGIDNTIPASIKDAINTRLIRLQTNERNFLETLSVIPGKISAALIQALFNEQAETLAMACVGRKLLALDAGQFRFKHELARLAILSRIASPRQRQIHQQVLTGLLCQDDITADMERVDQIVHHAAGAADGKRVLEFAPLAAEKASALGAHKEAASHFETALRFVDQASSEHAARLYEGWAFEASLSQRIDEQVLEALRVAITLRRSLQQLQQVGANTRHLSRLHWMRGESEQSEYYVDSAIAVLESITPGAELALAYSVRSQRYLVNDHMQHAIVWGEKALHLAREYNCIEAQIHALNNVGTAKAFCGDGIGQSLLEQSLTLSLQTERHVDAARAYANLSEYLVEFRRFNDAESVLAAGISFALNHDMIAKANYLQGILALLRLHQGRLRDAYTISEGVLASKKQNLLARLPAFSTYAKTKLRLGHQDALEVINHALSDALQTGEIQFVLPIRLMLIEFGWLQNHRDLIAEQFQALAKVDYGQLHIWWRAELAVWAKRTGTVFTSSDSKSLPEPYQLELNSDYEQAAQLWEQMGTPYTAALCRLQVNHKDQFLDGLENLKQELTTLEAIPLLKTLDRHCIELGITPLNNKKRRGPYKGAKNHPVGLTQREQEILGLLAKGCSNKEIANALVRSQRTVENHVSTVLSKLNAKNRLEAMLRVHNEPWLLPQPTNTLANEELIS